MVGQRGSLIARCVTKPERRKNFTLLPFMGAAAGFAGFRFFPETRDKAASLHAMLFFLDPRIRLCAMGRKKRRGRAPNE